MIFPFYTDSAIVGGEIHYRSLGCNGSDNSFDSFLAGNSAASCSQLSKVPGEAPGEWPPKL